MAQAVNVNFRMDAELKESMEEVCSDMGLTMTAAFTIFAKKVSREKRIPFEISADPFYSESNIQYLEKKIEEYKIAKLEKEKRNAEYLAMLDESHAQLERGETISFTLEELREMESDSWKPTEKVLEFERKHGIKKM